MKKLMLLVLMVSMTVVTGCDFFRKLAGRPTSEDIEQKRIEIMRAQEAAHQARLDSIKVEHQKVVDSLVIVDSIRQQGGTLHNSTSLGGVDAAQFEARYYIVVGSFRSRTNAETQLKKVPAEYSPAIFNFQNGMYAVGAAPSDNLKDAYASLKKLRAEKFCPSDVWILVNE